MSKSILTHWTVSEAAAEIGISISRLGKRLRAGKIKGTQLSNGHWMIAEAEVLRFANLPVPARGPARVGSPSA